MSSDPSATQAWSEPLSAALRAIRRARQLRAVEVARRMGMARRTYTNFEAGRGPLSFERIYLFAQVTDSDPYAIVASMLLNAPALAVRTTENKFIAAYAILLEEFNASLGDDIARLDTMEIVNAFSVAFKTLRDSALVKRDRSSPDWFREHAAKLRRFGKTSGGSDSDGDD